MLETKKSHESRWVDIWELRQGAAGGEKGARGEKPKYVSITYANVIMKPSLLWKKYVLNKAKKYVCSLLGPMKE